MVVFNGCRDSDILSNLNLPESVIFTHLPTDLTKMEEFVPIGQMRVIPKVHGGFLLRNPFQTPSSIPVYAMSKGVIINIIKERRHLTDHGAPAAMQGMEYHDYHLDIALTSKSMMYYGHIMELSEEIIARAGNIREGRGRRNSVKIEVNPGDVLGYIGTIPGLDIGMYDLKREHYFANPGRYTAEYRSTVSYTDYLTESLRNQIWEINMRTEEPRGGTIAYDVEGTLSGNWFLEGTRSINEWSKQLVFGRHDKYGDRLTIVDASPLVDGDGMLNDGRDSYVWWVQGNGPMPPSITASSGKVKYHVAKWYQFFHTETIYDGTILLELQTENRLRYQFFENAVPEDITDFTAGARTYVR
ncbi:MAG: hypothetical protein JJU28_06425 [Cyclobacteriaceae bacterium]|nr:hypothetical protein [Cyclobacteriaceae bacterium]